MAHLTSTHTYRPKKKKLESTPEKKRFSHNFNIDTEREEKNLFGHEMPVFSLLSN